MITTVSNTGALWAAIKSAQSGDVIQLAPGAYDALRLDGARIAGEVTITSADPSNPATIAGLNITSSSGLSFSNIDVKVNPATGFAVQLGGTSNMKFDSMEFYGTAVGDGNAVMVRNSTNVTVSNSEAHHLQTGLNHLNSNNVNFLNNTLHDLQADGIRGGGSSDVTISGNYFTNFYPKAGDHPDAIQFWTVNTSTAAKNLVITNNVFVRGDGGAVQGIFVGNENKIPFEGVTITGNAIIGGMYHGISLSYGNNVVVADNLVQGYSDMTSWIMLNQTTGAQLTNNEATAYQYSNGNVGLVNIGNVSLKQGVIGDVSVLKGWADEKSISLDDVLNTSPTVPAPEVEILTPLNGTASANNLVGTSHGDLINGGAGGDTMTGLAGNDTYVVDSSSDRVVEAAANGIDTVQTYLSSYTLPANVENLVLISHASVQAAWGNELDNLIVSNGFKTNMNGGAGADVLVSNGGLDKMSGGAGADVFVFQKMPSGVAQITDFTPGEDLLDLSALSNFYAGQDPVQDQWIRITNDGSGTTISIDANGSVGGANFVSVVKLVGVESPLYVGSDFVF